MPLNGNLALFNPLASVNPAEMPAATPQAKTGLNQRVGQPLLSHYPTRPDPAPTLQPVDLIAKVHRTAVLAADVH